MAEYHRSPEMIGDSSVLTAAAEATGIKFTLRALPSEGETIKYLSWWLGEKHLKTLKLQGICQQVYIVNYIEERTKYNVSVYAEKAAKCRSHVASKTVELGTPEPPSHLKYLAGRGNINFTFTPPIEGDTGGCPIKSFSINGKNNDRPNLCLYNKTGRNAMCRSPGVAFQCGSTVKSGNWNQCNQQIPSQYDGSDAKHKHTDKREKSCWRDCQGKIYQRDIKDCNEQRKFTVGYVDKRTEHKVSVFVTNAAGFNSTEVTEIVQLGIPEAPYDLTHSAGESGIRYTFNLPGEGATGGCPIKSFNWRVGGGKLLKQEMEDRIAQPNFTVAYIVDQTEYKVSVFVRNAAGFESAEVTKTVQLAPPKLREQNFVKCNQVERHHDVTLSCEYGIDPGCPAGRVTWTHNKRQIVESQQGPNCKYQRRDDTPELKIQRAEYSDHGDYICELKNHLGHCSVEFSLTVVGAPILKHVTEKAVTVDYLSGLNIEATGESNSAAKLQWSINESVIPDESGFQLIKEHVGVEDVGEYTLKAENEYGFHSISFNVRAKRHLIFVIAGISENVSTIVNRFNSFRDKQSQMGSKEESIRPCEFVAVPYTEESSHSLLERRKDEEGVDNIAFGTFDHVYRDHSLFRKSNCVQDLARRVTVLIHEKKNRFIADSHSFIGVYAGGAALGEVFALLKDEKDIKWNTALTYKSHIPLDQKMIPQLKYQKDVEITKPNYGQASDSEELRNYTVELQSALQSESCPWFSELNRMVCDEKAQIVRSFSPIMLAGFYKRTIEEVQDMLTNLLPDGTDKNSIFISAPMARASDFGEHMQTTPGMRKCIIVATFTERMNLLHEGADSGQVTAVYYEAQKRNMEILLLCMGLPKSQYSMKKEEARLYHQQLSALFRTQTILHGLAKTERFISLLSGERLDKDQTEALNKFLDPVSIREPPRRSYWGSIKEKMPSFDFSFN